MSIHRILDQFISDNVRKQLKMNDKSFTSFSINSNIFFNNISSNSNSSQYIFYLLIIVNDFFDRFQEILDAYHA